MQPIAAIIAVAAQSGNLLGAHLGAVVGSGEAVTESRPLSPFHAVEAKMAGNVDIAIGAESQVAVTGDDNIVSLLETTVENGVLTISSKSPYAPKSVVRFQVVTPSLDRVALDGAGNVTVAGLREAELVAVLNGAGNLKAEGAVDKLRAVLNGVGNLEFAGLSATSVDVELNGAGNAEVLATAEIGARLNGVGSISVHGDPAKSDFQRHGVGVVRRV